MPPRALYDLPAPAKLNRFLHIVGRRPDGYHLLQSLFVLIDWADTLHLERRDDGRLQRHDLGPPLPEDDLSLRAARALQAASGVPWGADISVLKTVPWGAGMGGGSSDAATVLLGLNRLWGLDWPRERLLQLATPLGADVPFFVGGENAFVEGIGERLTPVQVQVERYAVVKPLDSLATAEIFSHPGLARNTDAAILAGSLVTKNSGSGQGFGHNDLQPVAEQLCPAITEVAQWLQQRFGNSRMTGSGSAVFAVQPAPPATVKENEGTIGGAWPEGDLPTGWVGRSCHGLSRHPLRDWAR